MTIDLAEADPSEQLRRREILGEPCRTLIGHFRHEIAHFLFERLAGSGGFPAAFRALFGGERQDYGAARARHYDRGPPPDWQDAHVTPCATAPHRTRTGPKARRMRCT